jgi:hypothetical protein
MTFFELTSFVLKELLTLMIAHRLASVTHSPRQRKNRRIRNAQRTAPPQRTVPENVERIPAVGSVDVEKRDRRGLFFYQ